MNLKLAGFLQSDLALITLAAISAAVLIVLIFSGLLRRILASMTWAQIFLLLLIPFLAAGVLIPQTGSYEAIERLVGTDTVAKQRLIGVLKALNVAHIYASPAFIILFDVILLATFVCAVTRLFTFAGRARAKEATKEDMQHMGGYVAIRLSVDAEKDPTGHVTDALRKIGWGRVTVPYGVRRKGLGGLFMSLAWHIGLALLLFGCVVTFFAGFEGELSCVPGKPAKVPVTSTDTLWHKFDALGDTIVQTVSDSTEDKSGEEPSSLQLVVEGFKVTWGETVCFEYPAHKVVSGDVEAAEGVCEKACRGLCAGWDVFLQRLKRTWSFGEDAIQFEMAETSEAPLSLESVLKITDPDGKHYVGTTRVNRPLRYKNLRFYQTGCSYTVELSAAGKKITVKDQQPFSLPTAQGKFVVKRVADGTLEKLDGKEEALQPLVVIERLPESAGSGRETFVLRHGSKGAVGTVEVTPTVTGKASILRYRYDPGLLILRIGMVIMLIGLAGRAYLSRYHLRYLLEKAEDRAVLHVVGSEHGLFASGVKLIRKLQATLGE